MSKSIFQLAEHPWLSLLIVALAVIYPALKAAFLDPVEAIHHH